MMYLTNNIFRSQNGSPHKEGVSPEDFKLHNLLIFFNTTFNDNGSLFGSAGDELKRELENLRAINRRWAQLAGTDRLTGLPNKLALLQALVPQELTQARQTGESMGAVLLSGDEFGPVNETHGRAVGDLLLRELAELLQSVLKGEELLGHVDGTHFAVFFRPADGDAAFRRADDLRRQVEAHTFDCSGTNLRITLSSGSMRLPDDGDPRDVAEAALLHLGEALLRAKREGGNCVVPV